MQTLNWKIKFVLCLTTTSCSQVAVSALQQSWPLNAISKMAAFLLSVACFWEIFANVMRGANINI